MSFPLKQRSGPIRHAETSASHLELRRLDEKSSADSPSHEVPRLAEKSSGPLAHETHRLAKIFQARAVSGISARYALEAPAPVVLDARAWSEGLSVPLVHEMLRLDEKSSAPQRAASHP